MPITARNIIVKSQTPPSEEARAVLNEIEETVELKPESTIVQMEEGTVIHNGQPKKFNKKMSAYMIDMLTSEE